MRTVLTPKRPSPARPQIGDQMANWGDAGTWVDPRSALARDPGASFFQGARLGTAHPQFEQIFDPPPEEGRKACRSCDNQIERSCTGQERGILSKTTRGKKHSSTMS